MTTLKNTAMALNLALALRPQSLCEVIGQDKIKPAIRNFIDRQCHQWLFHGVTGTGKTSLAHIVAREFGCSLPLGNLLETNAADVRGLADMRDLLQQTQTYSMWSKHRVIILDETQQLTSDAKSLLLKPLEQEDSVNIWIFCTMDVRTFDRALRDRCPARFRLEGMDAAARRELVFRAAEHLNYKGDTSRFLNAIEHAGYTSARDILASFESFYYGLPVEEAVEA